MNPCIQMNGVEGSPLHIYLESTICFPRVVEFLLDHGADVNSIDAKHHSPLSKYLSTIHIEDKIEICRLLLQRGADPLWQDGSGKNLAHVSMLHPAEVGQVLRILDEYGTNVAAKDQSGKSILHHGALHGSLTHSILDSLEVSFLPLLQPDDSGMTPILYAENYAIAEVQDDFIVPFRTETLKVLQGFQGDEP
ncbi:hypothetical protein N7481_004905 [Penicillium waksmanii]|uniref:uncharacterized protein n=1 Tax=Penicillium waksmanii TaxID=69791 RepID=UPI0025480DD7|nr:uncharacterized protein N7481_004905 [Penicillium waksmanii]KAJ5989695.1 hypothetical protein N7481_004905 [Penicillium waksmanii]